MGQVTPNIGIYIPAAGETNYDAAFAAGMINIDQHDHSGGPNKGVPIGSSGLDDGSVTYSKLDANVADNTTGIGTHTGSLANQLYLLGLLSSIFNISTPGGLIVKDGTNAHARTITGTANKVTVTNGDGVSGNPTITLPSTIYTNISFDSGTTTLSSYATATFTPTLAFGGASVGITYAVNGNIGKYWKIGNVVYFNIIITLTSKGSSTGAATIQGLPFTSANDGFFNVISDISKVDNYPAGCTFLSHEIDPNTTHVNLAAVGAGNRTALLDTNFANTDEIQVSGFYWTV